MQVSWCYVMADRRLPQAMHLHAARHWHVCSAYRGDKTVLHASYNRACGQGLQVLKNVCLPCGISKISFIIRLLRASFFTVNWFWKGPRNQAPGNNFEFVVSVLQLMPDGLVATVLTTKKMERVYSTASTVKVIAQTFDIQHSARAEWQISAGKQRCRTAWRTVPDDGFAEQYTSQIRQLTVSPPPQT